MRAVWQRVSEAWVEVSDKIIGRIGKGALVLLGVESDDTDADAALIAEKCVNLRVFDDKDGRLNLSLADIGGELLLVSQFTLCADCRKGRRPSFVRAAAPGEANRLYELVADMIRDKGIKVKTGRFQSHMKVHLVNDGPVTLLLDSRKRF
ncbi:MAG: D-tyrosyl-tRNA(Tyr) deacylase [Deltaproteobacteria bacterium]|mgnify:CR=1 FL=1|nr:D-tyrosyl-tRNA(Tyr) deacylase [Deltaproteobacteria bacterium]RLB74453.1 MAG: D-tyrosyl-tRNA(Tyr) deacylase [Deltaproteobacteria bacterium]